ncbi:MAG: response regulator [Gammaproteobacteria bacterium]|nr:response regulator [Gammaproteobacteria bacterium]
MSAPENNRILVVDDTSYMRKMLTKILEDNGYLVIAEAGSGVEAIAMYQEHTPDLVTMDMIMPEMDGLTAVQKIIEIDAQAKVIMISSLGQEDKIEQARKVGAIGVVTKPIDNNLLFQNIESALS